MFTYRFAAFAVFALGVVTAVLYSSMLPLWGGFDEPFHYGYVQSLSEHGHIPLLNRDHISVEIERSVWLNAYASKVPAQDRPKILRDGRAEIDANDAQWKRQPSTVLNYEGQQAPLAYLLLAPINKLLSPVPLRSRILTLRLLLSIVSVVAILCAARLLFCETNLAPAFRLCGLFLIASFQMLYSTVAHVSNDWLALPLMTAFLGFAVRFARTNEPKSLWAAAAALAAGLLTKAYFLAFVPVFLASCVYAYKRRTTTNRNLLIGLAIAALAAPWYLRNKLVTGNFSGLQDAGFSPSQFVSQLVHTNWSQSLGDLARGSLWTGDWSFLSYSKSVMNFELLLLLIGLVCYIRSFRRIATHEWWLSSSLLIYVAALVYDGAMYGVYTQGAATHAEPFYATGIYPGIWALVMLGAKRTGRFGRYLAFVLTVTCAWISLNSYVVKLIPFYGGMPGRATGLAVWNWWMHGSKELFESVALAPAAFVYTAVAIQAVLLVACTGMVIRHMMLEAV